MKARWLTLFACVPLIVGTVMLMSCGGVGGPTSPAASAGSNAPTQNFLALLTSEQKASKYIGPEACGAAACHGGVTPAHVSVKSTTGGVKMQLAGAEIGQYATWKQTLHAQNGVSCENCHGPGGAHQTAPTNADGTPHAILTFPSLTSVEVCGQCHGPQHDDFLASKHSQLVPDPITSTVSNPASSGQGSQCMVCHGGLVRAQYTENGVLPAAMTLAQITQVCNDVLNTVPTTASCATCHNPHSKTSNLTGTGQEAQLYHSVSLTDSSGIGPGTTVAKFAYVNQTCGECHNGRGTTATDAYLTANTSRPSVHHSNQFNSLLGVGGWEDSGGPPQRSGTHALAPGQCTTCHMPLGRHTMTVSYDNGCAPCHTTADAAARASSLQSEVVNDLTALNTRMSNWAKTTFGDAQAWDYTSNITDGSTPPSQSKIPIQIKRARHNYYYVVTSGDLGVHNPAYTRYLMQVSATNLTAVGVPMVKPADVAQIPMAEKLLAIKQDRSKGAKSSLD